jgi:hypothetical protein
MVPDYYAMLGVDVGADRSELEAALARQQPKWSSGTRNPKTKHTYQSYLDQIPALRQALLGEPGARAAYDAELAAARRIERDQKLDVIQGLIRLRAAKGGLTVGDRALLRDEAVKLGLTADDLDRLIETIPPQPEAPPEVEDVDPPRDVLDAVTRRQIRVALEHLRHRDLYDALGLHRDAPTSEIAARADAERQRWMQKAQVTAQKTAWLEVVSLAQSHLSQPPARERYDRTLELDAEETFGRKVEFAVKGAAKLDHGTRRVLLDEASALGIDPVRAEKLLARACRAHGVAPDNGAVAGTGHKALRLLRCRACSGVTDHAQFPKGVKSALCRHCRADLLWKCPVCQRQRWVDEPRCACGFRIELAEPMVRHFEAAQHAFRVRDLDAAQAHLERVQEFAPHHVGARKGIAKIRERRAEIDRAKAAWETATATGRLVAAREAVGAWTRLVDPSTPELKAAWADVSRRLRDAEALAAKARALESSDPRAARALYRQSLAIASDLPDALAGLERCPPDPPTDLRAEFLGDRVRLRWTPPVSDGPGPTSYVILRKTGASFQHPRDGTRIGEVSATEFDDVRVGNGESVSYAVLSQRGPVLSLAAVSLGPIHLLADVADVRVETRSREVDLSWTAPSNALHVIVIRKQGGPPVNAKDGERVESLRDRASDRGLVDERVYYYAIYAVYKDHDGRLLPSAGVVVSAQPHQPIAPLAAPRLAQERSGQIKLVWHEPVRGQVKIFRSTKPLPAVAGDRLAPRDAEAFDGSWLPVSAPDQAVDPDPPHYGVCTYTPMTAWAGRLTVGHSVLYSCVPDPSDLRATRVANGRRVHLRWRWSPQGSESRIVARSGSPPVGPQDPDALIEMVHEGEYSRQGYYSLALPPGAPGPWHVMVYAVATIDGARVFSPGLDPTASTSIPGPHPEVTISYEFRRPKFPGRPWSLTLRTEPAGELIPPTALVSHPRTVPLSADDGEIVARFPEATDGSTFVIPGRVDLSSHRARIFTDPTVEPDSLPPIRLRHPETAATRV